jgi:hypothetical protein
MKENYIIPKSALEHIEGSSLFYPCSGKDTLGALKLFSPYITDFWYTDIYYFGMCRGDRTPTPGDSRQYKFISREIKGPERAEMTTKYDEVKKEYYRDIEPCVVTEKYLHIPSGRIITFNLKRGFGEYTLRNFDKKLGVFYYRGDSGGEGGSGITWLDSKRIKLICSKLMDGGLIVTDGSNSSRNGKFNEFEKYHHPAENKPSPEEMIGSMKPMKGINGLTITCIGYAGERYGATLIWQIKKPDQKDGLSSLK